MEQPTEHSSALLAAAAAVIVVGSFYGPRFTQAQQAATELALLLQEAGYHEEDVLGLLDYACDELGDRLDESPLFKQPTFPERLFVTVRDACFYIGHSLVSPGTFAVGAAELAAYEKQRGLCS